MEKFYHSVHCWWGWKWYSCLENSLAVPQQVKLHFTQDKGKPLHKMFTTALFIRKPLKIERTQKGINPVNAWSVGNYRVVCHLKRSRLSKDTCRNTDELWKDYYVGWKALKINPPSYDFIYIKCPEQQI